MSKTLIRINVALAIACTALASQAAPKKAKAKAPPAAEPAPAPDPAPVAEPAPTPVVAPAPADAPASPTPVAVDGPTDGNSGSFDNGVSLFGVFNYIYGDGHGFGVAARYQKTLIRGIVLAHHPRFHDDMGIEVGPTLTHYSFDYGFGTYSHTEFSLVAGWVWNFWFSDKFAAYPKLEIGYRFGSDDNVPGIGGFEFIASAGAMYKIEPVTLRAEVGSGELRLGAGMQF
jgi:hypothetical protein